MKFPTKKYKKKFTTHKKTNPCMKCNTISTCTSERWKKAYDIVKIENDLINHRITSLLATNGFLFAGLYFLFGAFFQQHKPFFYYTILKLTYLIIVFIGLTSSFAAGKGVRAASRQIKASSEWLYSLKKDRSNCDKITLYPPIVGIRSNFLKAYHDILLKTYSIPLIGPRLHVFLNCFLFKRIISFIHRHDMLREPSYDKFNLNSQQTDDINSMCAGVIYFPNILFAVWVILLFFGLFVIVLL